MDAQGEVVSASEWMRNTASCHKIGAWLWQTAQATAKPCIKCDSDSVMSEGRVRIDDVSTVTKQINGTTNSPNLSDDFG